MKQKILEMLELQNKLNTMTSGENWRDGITNKGKIISWKRCMYMEMVEAIDSTPWKHWKAIETQTDIKNFVVELVDIWHFLQSEILRFMNVEQAADMIEKYISEKSKSKLPTKWSKEENLKLNEYLEDFENFVLLCFKKENNVEDLTKQFFKCLYNSNTIFDYLYKLYIGKNVLNKFRQEHGYKEGKYKKIWSNGKEDNVAMQNYIETHSNFSFDDLYNFLEREYNK